jgi:hypothetical protein
MKKENNIPVWNAIHNARLMWGDFSALEKILLYNDGTNSRSELFKYIDRKNKATTPATKAKWYYEIINTFHAASAILHNSKITYKCMVTDIDMDDLKEHLKEQAKVHLAERVSPSTWRGQVRIAALKGLDLEELI